jgi:hypothetical protein
MNRPKGLIFGDNRSQGMVVIVLLSMMIMAPLGIDTNNRQIKTTRTGNNNLN